MTAIQLIDDLLTKLETDKYVRCEYVINELKDCNDKILQHNISYNEIVTMNKESFEIFKDGTIYFRFATTKQDLQKSLDCFDSLIKINIECKKKLWQRGITLFYLDKFEDAAEQFRFDVAQNPNDTEESIWCYLCENKLYGKEKALQNWINVGIDDREVMRITYNLFLQKAKKKDLLNIVSKSEKNAFYAYLYLGLYEESENNIQSAKEYMTKATLSTYTDDYMYDLSVVHMKIRGWQ